MNESAEAYCKRILGDIPEFEERISSALNAKKGKAFHLKRAGTILYYMRKNIEFALSLINSADILERGEKGRIKKGGKKRK